FRAELLEQPCFVGHEPGLGDPAARKAEHAGLADVDGLAGRGNPVEVRLVGWLAPEQHSDEVALSDPSLALVLTIGEPAAQVGARAREALALRIGGKVRKAAAPALVVGREHLALDQGFVLGALQLLEAADHRLVALELAGIALRGRPWRSGECKTSGRAE